jgi:hypothetical protein
MSAAIASFPSLSDLLAWPTEHLTEAAGYWTATGNRWHSVFDQVWQESLSVDWKGDGAEALHTRAYADKVKVSGLVDQLHEAAKVARAGASDLYAARSRVRYAIADARDAGFVVREDLSVMDRRNSGSAAERAARQIQAQTLAGDIRQRAAQLVGLDQQVAGNVTTAMAGIGNVFPADNPTTTTTTPTAPMPECDLDEIAKLHRKVDDLDRREQDLRRRIDEFNKLPHEFNANDPAQVEAAKQYDAKRTALVQERDTLTTEEKELVGEIRQCGIKMYSKNGQEIIEWPDGSTTPTPTPTAPR